VADIPLRAQVSQEVNERLMSELSSFSDQTPLSDLLAPDVHSRTKEKLCTTSWGAGRTDRQLSARVSRHRRLLRDHGLIRKLPNRHRCHLTNNGGN
jgi:hypothetical protein